MFRRIARIITRIQGDNDGLFIGSVNAEGLKLIKPNSIYELQTNPLSEDITLKYIGPAIVSTTGETCSDSPINLNWGLTIEQIVDWGGKNIFLTREEFKNK